MKTLGKSAKEVIKVLQSNPAPGEKAKSIWEELKDQSMQAGTWDPKLMVAIEAKITNVISSIDEEELRMLWETTEPGIESFDETSEIPLKKIKADVGSELLSMVMDKLDSSVDFGDDLNQTKFMGDDGFKDDIGFDAAIGDEDDLF